MKSVRNFEEASGFAAKTARLTKGGSIFGSLGEWLGMGLPRGLRVGMKCRRRRTRNARLPDWKRTFDLAVVVGGAPVWVPVGLLLAAWIQTVSPGPIFFRQERIGFKGRRFGMWKFRSMHPGADEGTHGDYITARILADAPITKLDAVDARLIPGARFFRGAGLDELPQLIHVLRGEMSFIGPRPCTPREYASCGEIGEARAGLLPGITGHWQVNGKNRTTFREMLELDRTYGREMSLWMDLAILLRTFGVVVRHAAEPAFASRDSGGRELSR